MILCKVWESDFWKLSTWFTCSKLQPKKCPNFQKNCLDLGHCNVSFRKTYLTLPPHRWQRSPVHPGLQTQFPVFLSQWPLAVHGFAQAKVDGVVVTAISGGVKAIFRRSWSDDPSTDRISKMWMKTRRLHSNLDLAAIVFSWNLKWEKSCFISQRPFDKPLISHFVGLTSHFWPSGQWGRFGVLAAFS